LNLSGRSFGQFVDLPTHEASTFAEATARQDGLASVSAPLRAIMNWFWIGTHNDFDKIIRRFISGA